MQHLTVDDRDHVSVSTLGARTRTDWRTSAVLSLAIFLALLVIARLTGLALADRLAPGEAVTLVNMLALTVLVWPVAGLALRCLAARRGRQCWGALLYPPAVVAFMVVSFGKPVALPELPAALELAPTVLIAVITAWLAQALGTVLARPAAPAGALDLEQTGTPASG